MGQWQQIHPYLRLFTVANLFGFRLVFTQFAAAKCSRRGFDSSSLAEMSGLNPTPKSIQLRSGLCASVVQAERMVLARCNSCRHPIQFNFEVLNW
jgi:hypothetical protein